MLIKKIGEGSFGEVYLALDNKKNKQLAVKCESVQTKHQRILYETFVMQELKGCKQIPKNYGYG